MENESRTSDEEYGNDGDMDQTPPRVRGVKKGTKRGKYKKSSGGKMRVIETAINQGNWVNVAKANGVPYQTAYGWLRNSEDENSGPRGGRRNAKVTEQHIQKMVSIVEKDPLVSLVDIKKKFWDEDRLSISTTTIHKHLDGQLITVKKVLPEPISMNSPENKRKRSEYVASVMKFIGDGKNVIYIDESNCNLFSRRTFGRSRKGARCTVKVPTSKGKNVHIIAGISQTGIVHWERRRGSYRNEDCNEWLRRLLRRLENNVLQNTVIVCDNAPVHSRLESVMEDEEFRGCTILRLAPYSAPLNPIEECWSVVKNELKRLLKNSMENLLINNNRPEGMNQTEYRTVHLESLIDESMPKITPTLCMRTCNHVQRHFPSVLALQNLTMGDLIRA